jgi:hypothetical protein
LFSALSKFPHPLAKRRGRTPDIHGHVEHFTLDDAHQLSLRLPDLVMQPPQHAARGSRMIVLHERDRPSDGLLESALVETLKKKAPIVTEDAGLEQDHIGDAERGGFHSGGSVCGWGSKRRL